MKKTGLPSLDFILTTFVAARWHSSNRRNNINGLEPTITLPGHNDLHATLAHVRLSEIQASRAIATAGATPLLTRER